MLYFYKSPVLASTLTILVVKYTFTNNVPLINSKSFNSFTGTPY